MARPRGQILVLFALGLVALFTMAGLLFDGAQALVNRRQLQDAGDAAALAAVNIIQSGTTRGCSATAGPPPGSARPEVVAAAVAAVTAALPGFPAADIVVTCPADWSNFAVGVDLDRHSPGFFASVAGFNGFDVATTSQAVNGQITGLHYSIVELDPSNLGWPNGRRGCPSVLISGGPTIILEGSMQINSACTAANGGALGTNGNAATVTMYNGAIIRMVGGYVPGPLTMSPLPVTGQTAVKDPLAGLIAVPISSLPVRSASKLTLNSGMTVLLPGVYVGGISMKSSAKAVLRPGIFVMQGGGFDMGSQNEAYSVAATISTSSSATWASDCPVATCGVLLYNTGTTTTLDDVAVGAGATMKLRPYQPSADTSGVRVEEYDNLLLWQDAIPVPASNYAQPPIDLSGGGLIDISGTIYAPSAALTMGGGSGGSGGSSTNLTLQFITWDLEFHGNTAFHFYFQDALFAKPTDYGLIK